MMIGIYKITSPSNKIYVGQSINIEKRFSQYKKLDCKKQPKLYNSLLKYGPENHIFEIIEECSLEELNFKEILWKQKYNTINEGLNCELFDIGQGPRSKQVRDKISNSMKGKLKTEEHKQNLSKSKIGIPSKRKNKPDLKQRGKPKPGAGPGKGICVNPKGRTTGKPVLDLETGKTYEFIKDIIKEFGFHKRKIYNILKDKNGRFKYLK